jgi:hypothetical protein
MRGNLIDDEENRAIHLNEIAGWSEAGDQLIPDPDIVLVGLRSHLSL